MDRSYKIIGTVKFGKNVINTDIKVIKSQGSTIDPHLDGDRQGQIPSSYER